MHRAARRHQRQARRLDKRRYNQNHQHHTFQVGDLVKIFLKDTTKNKAALQPYWDGPWRVTQIPDARGPLIRVQRTEQTDSRFNAERRTVQR